MANIIMAVIKYLSILIVGGYTIVSFRALKKTTKEQKKRFYFTQNLLMYLFMVLSFITIYINTMADKVIITGGLMIIYFIVTINLYKLIYPKVNRMLLNNMCFLMSIGFVMLIRISYTRAVKQFIFCVAATTVSLVLPWIFGKTKALRKFYYLYGLFGLALLILVYIIGETTYGAIISLDLGFISVQPSEFAKISFVLFISGILHKNKSFSTIVISAVLGGAHVIVLVLSRDLGSALIYFVAYVFIIYAATGKAMYMFAGFVSAALASVAAYYLFSHVQVRVAAWYDPWSIIDDRGYQITQSLFGIGMGGWFGMGLYKGEPTYIPVVDQDFMFSAIAEEFGGFFAVFLIMIYLNLFIVFIRVAFKCTDQFYKTTVFGLAVCLGFQVFLTIGGAIKLIPSTGVTLPLISYGGSSVVATILVFAIIQGIYINQVREDRVNGK